MQLFFFWKVLLSIHYQGFIQAILMSVRRYKKLNLHKTSFQSILALTFCSKYIGLLGFFYFKLFISPLDVKKSKSFRGFSPRTSTEGPLQICCRAYSTLRPSTGSWFKNLTISRTAWLLLNVRLKEKSGFSK